MKKTVYLISIILVLFIAVPFAGCGGGGGGSDSATTSPTTTLDTPEKNISQLSTALKANDIDTTMECFSEADQSRMRAALEGLDQDSRNSLGEKIANAQIVEETDTTRIYKTSMDNGKGKIIDVRFGLMLMNGKWVIWFM